MRFNLVAENRKALVLIVVFIISANATALGYFDSMRNGTALPGIDAVSLGFGGIRSLGMNGTSSLFMNPSCISLFPNTSVSTSVGSAILSEAVEDSLGRHTLSWLALADLSFAANHKVNQSLALGIGIARITDMSYQGKYYVPDMDPGPSYGQIIAVDELKVRGGLFESVAGFSWMPGDWFSVGLSGGVRFGEARYDSTYEDRVNPSNSSDSTWGWSDEEICWHSGITFPLEMSTIGVSWASSGEHYDSRIAVGGMVYTGDRSLIGAEVEVIAPTGKNEVVGRIFGQKAVSESLLFRGALFFADRADEISRQTIGVSAGIGISFEELTLNAAFSWSSTKRDSDTFGYDDMDVVKDSQSLLSVGISREFH